MRIERQFNIARAKLVEVDEPVITTRAKLVNSNEPVIAAHASLALDIKVRFKASNAADGIAAFLTPDEAVALAGRLLKAAGEEQPK